MLAPHGVLVTKVTHKKRKPTVPIWVWMLSSQPHAPSHVRCLPPYQQSHHPDGPVEVVDVVGSLCENNDKFAVNRELPHTEIGDLLVIHDTGAHGFSMGYQYNAKLRSAETSIPKKEKLAKSAVQSVLRTILQPCMVLILNRIIKKEIENESEKTDCFLKNRQKNLVFHLLVI